MKQRKDKKQPSYANNESWLYDGEGRIRLPNGKEQEILDIFFSRLVKVTEEVNKEQAVRQTIDYLLDHTYFQTNLLGMASGKYIPALAGLIGRSDEATPEQMGHEYEAYLAGLEILQKYRESRFGSRLVLEE
ncbi:MAG: hypothetical protein HZB67_00665 [Candidatus Aenigmarchaeota archaeon]|nr:hypothetical protein [Candidatus Aenigmarchaeota archaeon]